jgi:hypothetical protein
VKFAKMTDLAEKQMVDEAMGLTHESGHHMMEPSSDDTTGKKKKKKKTVCRNCGCTTHATSGSSKCMHNSWGKEALAKEMVRRSIAPAAATAAGVAAEGGSSEVQSEGACDLIVSVETQATCNFSGTQSTCAFCMDAAVGNSVSVENELVEDALSTMAVEISDLDTVGFDDTRRFDESVLHAMLNRCA